MLGLEMSLQIHFSLERSVAFRAHERFVACVLSSMRDQVARLAECFPTHCALVGLFTCETKFKLIQKYIIRFFIF